MDSVENNGLVVCRIGMRFVDSEAERAVQLLLSVVERIGVKAGCESCSVTRDEVEPDRILYNEIWASESHFQGHVQSAEFHNVLVAMDMCCEKPRVVVGALSGRTGLEYLLDLRGGLEPAADPGT